MTSERNDSLDSGENPSPIACEFTTPRLRLGTRASALARWQADWVTDQLQRAGVEIELVLITTQGDASTRPLGAIGGQGVFTKEIQRALLDERIDLAVHSLKDLPTEVVPGLKLGAVPEREDNHDVLVCREATGLEDLPRGAKIGTGSIRRRAQLLHHRPDLQVEDIRGNVETRLSKLDEGQFDAIVLARAGLRRLELEYRVTMVLPRALMLPAVGQGALGIEIREDDATTQRAVDILNHTNTHAAVRAERSLLASLRAGCLAPVGAWARVEEDSLRMDAVVLNPGGEQRLETSVSGVVEQAVELGRQAAGLLIRDGASDLIADSRGKA